MANDLLNFVETSAKEAEALLALALDVKRHPEKYSDVLSGKSIAGLFEKPSLRTRVSFDVGINKLGGHFVYLDAQANKLAGREDAKDTAMNLACWCDAIVARVMDHQTLVEFADAVDIPVINALCDWYHPCQALADYLAMAETFEQIKGKTMCYIGDGNNVTHSLLLLGVLLGVNVTVITPKGFEADASIIKLAAEKAAATGAVVTVSNDLSAAQGADVLYADTWLSMGDDTPLAEIKTQFMPYQLNAELMQSSGAQYVMHCQPAHRDLEITGELMDSSASLLMLEAENRMHAQNAILVDLLG